MLELVVVIGKLAEAADNFELCYSLTKGKADWLTADGETSMHSLSCSNLTRIYTSIATHYSEQNDQESSLQYLIRAYEKSKEGQYKLFTSQSLTSLGYTNKCSHYTHSTL